jgi:hypothetical protein
VKIGGVFLFGDTKKLKAIANSKKPSPQAARNTVLAFF